jgi:hypothetical protein
MQNPTKRILIRSGKHPFTPVHAEAALARDKVGVFAGNIGNVLFSDSVTKAVSAPGVEVVSNSIITERKIVNDAYVKAIDEQFDSLVLPFANAFRPEFKQQLDTMASVIRQIDMPVTVVGIGAQHALSSDEFTFPEEFDETVKGFVGAVLDKSASIGVRGQLTKDYLKGLGFGDSDVDVIGCPSLYATSKPAVVEKKVVELRPDSALAVNVTPSIHRMGEILMHNYSRYPNMIYVPQAREDLTLMMYGESVRPKHDPNMPTYWDHPMFQHNRMRFFLDGRTWIEFMVEQEFAFGTRLHGNIAALIAGTPAYLLAHDSRTLELAEYHEIPHELGRESAADSDVTDFYEKADFTAFNAARQDRFDTYLKFLERNGIDHIFAHEGAEEEWDAKMDAVQLPPAVQTLAADEKTFRRDVAARLAWLRQGNIVDDFRRSGGYQPPFHEGITLPPLVPGQQLETHRKDIRNLKKENAALKAELADVKKLLKRFAEAEKRREQSIPRRAYRKGGRMLKSLRKP